MAKNDSDEVFVATKTAHVLVDGQRVIIKKGVTRVAAGHALLKKHGSLFKEAGEDLHFGVAIRPSTRDKLGSRQRREAAKLDEGGSDDDGPVAYEDRKKKDLVEEINGRNVGREDELQIHVPARASIATLAELLTADDDAQADAEAAAAAAAADDQGDDDEGTDETQGLGTKDVTGGDADA